ncbi:MAG: aminoacyl-histidine dipeptidase [Paludibacteraceae bacterium]|nr:aminoacyl-histidine dipeptidase [Paludibacteraceae bacterium]
MQVLEIFSQICQIPRPSKHEERISQWLQAFAREHHIECVADEAMNVILRVPATAGYEDHPAVILQAHMDMVCEKNSDTVHDFLTDPIETYVDGDWLKARGTTLGADNGIGIAMALAAITDPDLPHPAVECLFTVDEETGLTGAMKLQDGYLRGTRLINLDSEDDGQIFIGCAGGIDTLAKMHYTPQALGDSVQWFPARLSVSGLMGGHSGDDINKGRANANKVLVGFLQRLLTRTPLQLAAIQGGNLRNAIAREAEATICVPMAYKEQLRIEWNIYTAEAEKAYQDVEKDMRLELESCAMPAAVIPEAQAHRLIMALQACPHGMIAMSQDMPGLVETSTNLASVKMKTTGGVPTMSRAGKTHAADERCYIEVNTSQRSSVEASKHWIKREVEYALAMACDEVTHGDGYPGWAPNIHSPLLGITKQAYTDLFGKEPQVLAIHAGLECGLFLEKYPFLDMVSIGPQMYGVHSPQERLSLSSTDRCYRWLRAVLSRC